MTRAFCPTRRMLMMLLGCAFCALAMLLPTRAHAQTCSATISPINFGVASPINRNAVDASGTISVTCNWTVLSLSPAAIVCLNLATAEPRMLTTPGNSATLQYELYSDQAHTSAWGSVAAGTPPISVQLNQPALGTSATVTIPYYGEIAANQPTVPTTNNADTIYSHTFGGTDISMTYAYYVLGIIGPPGCSSITTSGGSPAFAATATVTNNCNIGASNLAFPAASLLSGALTATGTITAQCTNGDAFRISLSGGTSGKAAARTMQLTSGNATVSYQIYADQNYVTPWGDSSGGTSTVTGVGTGNTASYTMYGRVPAQTTPQPGNYMDTITATISF